jgi:hypothetical protein
LHFLYLSGTIPLMDDPRVLRIITVGLILAALAVVYFLFTGGFSLGKAKVSQTQTVKSSPTPTPVIAVASSSPSATPAVVGQSQPTPTSSPASSAYNAIANRNQGSVTNLPNTGFPAGLVFTFSVSAIAFGVGLRRFPK